MATQRKRRNSIKRRRAIEYANKGANANRWRDRDLDYDYGTPRHIRLLLRVREWLADFFAGYMLTMVFILIAIMVFFSGYAVGLPQK